MAPEDLRTATGSCRCGSEHVGARETPQRLKRTGGLGQRQIVVRNEALAVRRGRGRLALEELDLDARPREDHRTMAERRERAALVDRSAEALAALEPHEAQPLLMKAGGHSYQEIAALSRGVRSTAP
jgi:hypothetical protein